MKMREIIDMVSELYREEYGKATSKIPEMYQISDTLKEKGESITLGEYNALTKRQDAIGKEYSRQMRFADGIDHVRAMLMDLGFDTEVER